MRIRRRGDRNVHRPVGCRKRDDLADFLPRRRLDRCDLSPPVVADPEGGTSLSPSYRTITATVADPSRERVRTVLPFPSAYTFVTGADATGFSPVQNSITLKMTRSTIPVRAYGMTKIHVAALRTYFSSIDWLMSYSFLVNWNLPKHPAESAPTAATSTSAIPLPNRFPRMAIPLPDNYGISHCSASRDNHTIPRVV